MACVRGAKVNRYSLRAYPRAVCPVHASVAQPQKAKASALSVKDVYTAAAPFHKLSMDSPSYFDGRAFADAKELKALVRGIRMYAEFCQCTYSNYLSVRKDGCTPIPGSTRLLKDLKSQKDPNLLQQVLIAATGSQDAVDKYTPLKTPALPPQLFLAPFPASTPETMGTQVLPAPPSKYTFTDDQLSKQYGFLEPDSPIIEGGFKVSKYLYASSGIFDADPNKPDEVYWIGYIAYSLKLKEIVLAFRGTVHASEWQQNADIRADLATRWLPEVGQDQLGDAKIEMHQGFCEMYYCSFRPPPYLQHLKIKGEALEKQVVSGLLEALKIIKAAEAKDADFAKQPLALSITGHSLGGALSTIAAYDIIHDNDIAAAWPGGLQGLKNSLQGVTFAQPRVGNDEFVRDFNTKITARKWLRVLNVGDVVPQLPFTTLDQISELADTVFNALRVAGGYLELQRERPTKDTLLKKADSAVKSVKVAESAAGLMDEFNKDLINRKLGVAKPVTVYEHVGWQMRFDPDHPKFTYVASFGHTNSQVRKWLKSGVQQLFAMLQLDKFGKQYIEESVSLADMNVRHNLDVIVHMLDPSLDKVRMNRQWNCLVVEKLSPEERKRLGDRYAWWSPFDNSSMRLVKAADGSYKWTCVQKPASGNGTK